MLGFVVAGFGPLATAAVLSPWRDQPLTGIVVFALLVTVAVATVLAGPGAGALATILSALSYDFVFVPPYRVIKVEFDGQLWPLLPIVTAGLALGVVARRSWPPRSTTAPPLNSPPESQSVRIERFVQLVEEGTDHRDLISVVGAELTVLLRARSCRFEAGDVGTGVARIERNGSVIGYEADASWTHQVLEVPVRHGAHQVGRFVLTFTPGVSIPLEHRIVAVILSDHLAAALVAHPSTAPG